jgi:hypothetical protein
MFRKLVGSSEILTTAMEFYRANIGRRRLFHFTISQVYYTSSIRLKAEFDGRYRGGIRYKVLDVRKFQKQLVGMLGVG